MKMALIAFAALTTALCVAGCSSSKESAGAGAPDPSGNPLPAETEPERDPSPSATFGYLIQNENCKCPEFSTTDRKNPVGYTFQATYKMEEGFITSIKIGFENRSADTLFLDPGTVMVSSKNIDYQYNNKFLPLPDMAIPPGESEDLELDGKEVTSSPTWRKIAGEKLTLTLKGMRLGDTVLGTQTITFVPENPLLQDQD